MDAQMQVPSAAARWLGYLLLPARPVGLTFMSVLTALIALGSGLGLAGFVVALFALLAACAYGFVLIGAVAHGQREPPVLAIEMLNPADEQRPLVLIAVALLAWRCQLWLSAHAGPGALLAAGVAALFALPALLGALGASASLPEALDPRTSWRIVGALGASYAVLVLAALAQGLALSALVRAGAPPWLSVAAALFAWLSVCALTGGALYEHREALGLEAMHAPERAQVRARHEISRERARRLDALYAQLRGGNLTGAWSRLEGELHAVRGNRAAEDALLEALRTLADQRLAVRATQRLVRGALGGDNARALDLARAQLALDTTFRPGSADETLRLAELARLAGDRPCARLLLAQFGERFRDAGEATRAAAAALARD